MANETDFIVDANIVATAIFRPIVPTQSITVVAAPKLQRLTTLGATTVQGALISTKIGAASAIWKSSDDSVVSVSPNSVTPLGTDADGYTAVTTLTAIGLGRATVTVTYEGVSDTVEVVVGASYRICSEVENKFAFNLPPTGYQLSNDSLGACYTIPQPVQYTVTVNASTGGTVRVTNTQTNEDINNPARVNQNTSLQFTATPLPGYRFKNWLALPVNEDIPVFTPNGSVRTVVVTNNITTTAEFELIPIPPTPTVTPQYTVAVNSSTGGTVRVINTQTNVNIGNFATVNENTSLQFTAAPLPGYRFKNWERLSVDRFMNPVTVVVTNNITANAVFELIPPPPPTLPPTPTPVVWRECDQPTTNTNTGTPDLNAYTVSQDVNGVCYRAVQISWRTCNTQTVTPGTPPITYESSTDTTGLCYRPRIVQEWRDCVTGLINNGLAPADRRQVNYSGVEGGTCWEPVTQLTFTPSISDALLFEYQRGSITFPQPKTITVTNSSFGKTYSLSMTTNSNIVITPSTLTIAPRSTETFIVRVTADLLNELATGVSTLQMIINTQEF